MSMREECVLVVKRFQIAAVASAWNMAGRKDNVEQQCKRHSMLVTGQQDMKIHSAGRIDMCVCRCIYG